LFHFDVDGSAQKVHYSTKSSAPKPTILRESIVTGDGSPPMVYILMKISSPTKPTTTTMVSPNVGTRKSTRHISMNDEIINNNPIDTSNISNNRSTLQCLKKNILFILNSSLETLDNNNDRTRFLGQVMVSLCRASVNSGLHLSAGINKLKEDKKYHLSLPHVRKEQSYRSANQILTAFNIGDGLFDPNILNESKMVTILEKVAPEMYRHYVALVSQRHFRHNTHEKRALLIKKRIGRAMNGFISCLRIAIH